MVFRVYSVLHGSGDKWHIKGQARKFVKLQNISINHRANSSKQQSKPGLKALFRSEEAELSPHHLFVTRQDPHGSHEVTHVSPWSNIHVPYPSR